MQQTRPQLLLDQPGVRVQTLVLLRWVAIAGQLLALLFVGFGLGFPIPWTPALAAVAASISLNLGLSWLYRHNHRIDGRKAMAHLGFDLSQLAILIFLTGGLSNPFAVMLMVPITISATLLSARETGILLGVALLMLVGLWNWHLPLPWADEEMNLPSLYRLAVLVAIGLGMSFLSFYAWQVSAEGRRRQSALVATQAALDREARMGALGSLAAAAAHELGGPLGTIALIARDLEHAAEQNPELGPDIQLLNNEVRRCRDILAGIAERAEAEEPFPMLSIAVLLREVAESFEPTRVPVELRFPWPPGGGPLVRRSPEVLHGIFNIVSNALRHAETRVLIESGESPEEIWIRISDDGPGYSPDILPKLGAPFLGPSISGSGSTGLGIFIATTLLERLGARVSFSNSPEGGARVDMRWSRADIGHDARLVVKKES